MPELPEVETVKRTLERYLVGKKIIDIYVYYSKILANEKEKEFRKKLIGQTITGMNRRGKWLIFEMDDYDLVSHLRMEGKYFLKSPSEEVTKHEHVTFTLDNEKELRAETVDTYTYSTLDLKAIYDTVEINQEDINKAYKIVEKTKSEKNTQKNKEKIILTQDEI